MGSPISSPHWQNSVPWGCRTEILFFLLGVSRGSPSAPGGFLRSLPQGHLHLQASNGTLNLSHASILYLSPSLTFRLGLKHFMIRSGIHRKIFFAISHLSWGSQGKNAEVVCYSLPQWTTFYQNSLPWPVPLGWPYMAWLIVSLLDKAVIHVISLVRKQRGIKEPLDEGESREWKSWLKTQHSEN